MRDITRVLRVDTMMRAVHEETETALDAFYPAHDDPRPRSPDELTLNPAEGVPLATAWPSPKAGGQQPGGDLTAAVAPTSTAGHHLGARDGRASSAGAAR